jgi:hypothetical protein
MLQVRLQRFPAIIEWRPHSILRIAVPEEGALYQVAQAEQ